MKKQLTHAMLIAMAFVALGGICASAQPLHRWTGQNLQPSFDGWEKNPDGSFSLVFGYLNRNYEEELVIPVGPNNFFEPGGPDRGQPTFFYPRRQNMMFKVRVPADWPVTKRVVWTVTAYGRTDKASGWLSPEYMLTGMVWTQNREGEGGDGVLEDANPNKPPTSAIEGAPQRTITLGERLDLVALATDDGRPVPNVRPAAPPRPPNAGQIRQRNLPRPETPANQAVVKPPREGLGVTWITYRGPAKVSFSPMSAAVKNGKASTSVTFDEPGTYVLRAYADDGVFMEAADVTVIVKPAAAPK